MNNNDFASVLQRSGIRPTGNRLLIYGIMHATQNAVSMSDLEHMLPELDKSTIFRTLTLFNEKHLIHGAEDAGGMKYCIRDNNEVFDADESHCHFYCESCGKTYCLDKSVISNLALPEGFVMHGLNYLVKGICAECTNKESC